MAGVKVAELYELIDDAARQAEFMLPRLNEAQRNFIVRMKPTRTSQRIAKRDYDGVYPGVETGEEWPWCFWFGGTRANFPAGRSPLGKKRCSYGFCFSEAGLLVREALLDPPKTPRGADHEC